MFKRVRKELAKQQIEEDEFDVHNDEEKLAGVFSDSDTDSDDSDDEETRLKAINAQASDDDDDDDDDDSEEEQDDETNEEDNDDDEEEEEGAISSYTCDICPEKELKNASQVEVHLKSKIHRRRARFLKKQNKTELSDEKKKKIEERKNARVSAKLEKIKQRRKETKRRRAIKEGKITE
ncbi:unnamed protein product [Rhizopus stolonifer]